MTKKKLLKQLSLSSMVLVAALAVTNQSSSLVWAQEENSAMTASSENLSEDEKNEDSQLTEERREPKEGESLETYRQYLLSFLNQNAKNHPDLLQKYQDLLSKATATQDLTDIYTQFQKDLANAQRKTLQQRIEEAEAEAYKIPGFIEIPGHTALIDQLRNSSSEEEIDAHLNTIKEKGQLALKLLQVKEQTSEQIKTRFPYLGEAIAKYNLLISEVTDQSQLTPIVLEAEKEHKEVLFKLIKETKGRIEGLKNEIDQLPELDSQNNLYSNQRATWSYTLENVYPALRSNVTAKTNEELLEFYGDIVLYVEILADIELSSRKAAVYFNDFREDELLRQRVEKLFEGSYASIDGAYPGGALYNFYNGEFVGLFNNVETRYQELKQAQPKPAPEDKPKEEPKKEVIPALPLTPAEKIKSAVPQDAPIAEDKPVYPLNPTDEMKSAVPQDAPIAEDKPVYPLNPTDEMKSAVPQDAPIAEDKPIYPLKPTDEIKSAVPQDAPIAEDKPIYPLNPTDEIKSAVPQDAPIAEDKPIYPLNPTDEIKSAVPQDAPIAEDKPIYPLQPTDEIKSAVPQDAPIAEDKPIYPLQPTDEIKSAVPQDAPIAEDKPVYPLNSSDKKDSVTQTAEDKSMGKGDKVSGSAVVEGSVSTSKMKQENTKKALPKTGETKSVLSLLGLLLLPLVASMTKKKDHR